MVGVEKEIKIWSRERKEGDGIGVGSEFISVVLSLVYRVLY